MASGELCESPRGTQPGWGCGLNEHGCSQTKQAELEYFWKGKEKARQARNIISTRRKGLNTYAKGIQPTFSFSNTLKKNLVRVLEERNQPIMSRRIWKMTKCGKRERLATFHPLHVHIIREQGAWEQTSMYWNTFTPIINKNRPSVEKKLICIIQCVSGANQLSPSPHFMPFPAFRYNPRQSCAYQTRQPFTCTD